MEKRKIIMKKTEKMILINDSATTEKYENLLESFRNLYKNGFPDPNERESFAGILERLKEKDDKIRTSILIVPQGETALGGIISDCYPSANALHLLYIIVSPEARGQGIAKKLINEGIAKIMQYFRDVENIEIKNNFFESNNPQKSKIDNFDPKTRLKIFSSQGAKMIPINYIQPKLSKDKERVDYLLLLSFCQHNKNKTKMTADDVKIFLRELYAALEFAEDCDLSKMEKEIDAMKNPNDGNNLSLVAIKND
jgi:GNAT superfamily N-acetyltransferase